MKRFFTILVFLSVATSVYQEPPIENITIWNNGRAIELNNLFYINFSSADTINISWYSPLDINGSMAIAGVTPAVDNTTTYGNTTKAIVERGYNYEHLIGKDSHTICDGSRSPSDSLCDFDYDGCAETEHESHVFSVIALNFSFRNVSEYIEDTEIEHVLGVPYRYSPANSIRLPENISREIENASGKEVLVVNLTGKMTFVYAINDRSRSGLECITNYVILEKTFNFSDEFSCYASGRQKIFFVESPATNEQWFRSNKLSIILISQVPVYHSALLQNKEEITAIQLYDFNITENQFGVKNIVSLENDNGSFMGEINSTAGPLGNSNAFSYLYRFNYSYEKKIGDNNFTLTVRDFFDENESTEQRIFSRQLSYGNKTETGAEAGWETTRKSVIYEKQESGFVEILFGMLGMIVVVLFLRFLTR